VLWSLVLHQHRRWGLLVGPPQVVLLTALVMTLMVALMTMDIVVALMAMALLMAFVTTALVMMCACAAACGID